MIAPEPDRSRVRLATYNIHRAIGISGTPDPAAILTVIDRMAPDLFALQEVETPLQSSGGETLIAGLRSRNYQLLAGPTLMRAEGAYGNLLCLLGEVERFARWPLTVSGREPRGLLDATVSLHRTISPLRIIATHLGLRRRERQIQMRRMAAILGMENREQTVVMGDLNEWLPWTPTLARTFTGLKNAAPRTRTFPARWPLLPLDRILLSPDFKVAGHGVFRTRESRSASDHLPLWVDLPATSPRNEKTGIKINES